MSKALRIFGYPDIHFPDHDPRALACAEAAMRYFKPDVTVIGGDLITCEMFSTFTPSVEVQGRLGEWDDTEIEPAKAFLDRVQYHTNGKVIYLEGNHEHRVLRKCLGDTTLRSAGAKLLPKYQLSQGRENFQWVPWARDPYARKPEITKHCSYFVAPDLIAVHGWNYSTYAAEKHLAKAKTVSVIYHHCHRHQEASTRLPFGYRSTEHIKAMCPGCLCKLEPGYKVGGEPNDWTHGFWIAFKSATNPRDHTVYHVPIDRGRAIMPDGKEIKA